VRFRDRLLNYLAGGGGTLVTFEEINHNGCSSA
jgi:hypothetical protein